MPTEEQLKQDVLDGLTHSQLMTKYDASEGSIILWKKQFKCRRKDLFSKSYHQVKPLVTNCKLCHKPSKKNMCPICAVSVRSNAIKLALITVFGGKCSMCGYNKCHKALEFHHLDQDDKILHIADMLHRTKSLKLVINELKKCILICSNCHRELHHNESKSSKLEYQEKILNYITKNKLIDKIISMQ